MSCVQIRVKKPENENESWNHSAKGSLGLYGFKHLDWRSMAATYCFSAS
jgi:hypothetical protein